MGDSFLTLKNNQHKILQSLFAIEETTGLLVEDHHKIFFGPAYFLNDAEDKK